MKKNLAIIPARYASSRLPGKPLADIAGKTLIERVYRQAALCSDLSAILVATDDERIEAAVQAFGGRVVITPVDCLSGTDRCAAALEKLGGDWDTVVNIQGDEPFIQPDQISQVIGCLANASAAVGTLVRRIHSDEQLFNPNVVKAVLADQGKALYFSRSPIPFLRDAQDQAWTAQNSFFRHLGIYAFRADLLPVLAALPPGKLEQAESLEQLRWMEAGYPVYAAETLFDSMGIDTPEDLEAARKQFTRNS